MSKVLNFINNDIYQIKIVNVVNCINNDIKIINLKNGFQKKNSINKNLPKKYISSTYLKIL